MGEPAERGPEGNGQQLTAVQHARLLAPPGLGHRQVEKPGGRQLGQQSLQVDRADRLHPGRGRTRHGLSLQGQNAEDGRQLVEVRRGEQNDRRLCGGRQGPELDGGREGGHDVSEELGEVGVGPGAGGLGLAVQRRWHRRQCREYFGRHALRHAAGLVRRQVGRQPVDRPAAEH